MPGTASRRSISRWSSPEEFVRGVRARSTRQPDPLGRFLMMVGPIGPGRLGAWLRAKGRASARRANHRHRPRHHHRTPRRGEWQRVLGARAAGRCNTFVGATSTSCGRRSPPSSPRPEAVAPRRNSEETVRGDFGPRHQRRGPQRAPHRLTTLLVMSRLERGSRSWNREPSTFAGCSRVIASRGPATAGQPLRPRGRILWATWSRVKRLRGAGLAQPPSQIAAKVRGSRDRGHRSDGPRSRRGG